MKREPFLLNKVILIAEECHSTVRNANLQALEYGLSESSHGTP